MPPPPVPEEEQGDAAAAADATTVDDAGAADDAAASASASGAGDVGDDDDGGGGGGTSPAADDGSERGWEDVDVDVPSAASAGNESVDDVAAAAATGDDSDRDDYRRSGPPPPRCAFPADVAHADVDRGGPPASPERGDGALGKLRQWFGTTPSTEGDEEDDEKRGSEYRSFESPGQSPEKNGSSSKSNRAQSKSPKGKDRKFSLDEPTFEETLLDEDGGNEGDVELGRVAGGGPRADAPKRRAWGTSRPHRSLQGAEEEEVMGQCSFFYAADDAEAGPQPRLQSAMDDAEGEGHHSHYRARKFDPRFAARALRTRAARRWTERRYRRRLRQSPFFVPTPQDPHGEDGGPSSSRGGPAEVAYELAPEHRRAFLAAHAALNGRVANEYGRNRHAIRKRLGYDREVPYDLDFDLELGEDGRPNDGDGDDDGGEIRADLTRSSLAIRGGQIRLPADNVRLVCDPRLQPGILSVETRDAEGGEGGTTGYEGYGNANRYGNVIAMRSASESASLAATAISNAGRNGDEDDVGGTRARPRATTRDESRSDPRRWHRNELAYVLTVDEQIYRRLVREVGDSRIMPCGTYWCCHGDAGHDRVGIEVAVAILLVIFLLLVMGMVAWPTW
ncbi:hypothetical protein ACHAWF_003970 [Thalassiosira exigua]